MKQFKITVLALMLPATLLAAEQPEKNVNLDSVVVTGARYATDVRHLPMTVTTVDRQRLTVAEQPSILPTLQDQVPGLFVTSRGMMGYGVSTGAAGGMMLRGISSGAGQLLVLIDGHPQYQGIYGHSIADSYQTLMADRVEVLRGPASVLYGSNAMGGVINIVTRQPQHDGVRTSAGIAAGSWGTLMADVTNQVRLGRFSSTVAGQYSRTDNHRPHMGFEQFGGMAKLGYELSANWALRAAADVTHFNASYPGSVQAPILDARQWITRGVAEAGVDNHYGRTNGSLSVYCNFGRHKINDGHSPNAPAQTRYFRSKDALTGISWYQTVQPFAGTRITAGFDWQHIYGHAYYTSIATGEVLDTPNKQSARQHNDEVAGYADVRQDVSTWLTLDAGIRWDHHSVTGSEWIPQGGIVIRPMSTGELKASVGKGFRNPTMREMYLYPPSNTELKPERLVNYELSWRHRLLQGRVSYGINLFYIDADNIIQVVERRNVNTGSIKNSGIELEGRWLIDGHWTFSTNHSWLHMKHHVLGAPEYKGYFGGDFHSGKWTATAGLQYVSGLFTRLNAQGEDDKENYWMSHITVRYQLTKAVNLWATGDNVLAQSYETLWGYPEPKATFMGGIRVTF